MMMISFTNLQVIIITEWQWIWPCWYGGLIRLCCWSSWWWFFFHDELDLDDGLAQVNSVRINETRAESNKTNGDHSTESKISRKDSRSSNGDHSIDSKISRKDSKTSKDLPPVPPREREPPPVPSMESLISRRASSSRNEIYSKLRLLSLCWINYHQ